MSRDVGVGQLVEELEQRGDRLPFEIGAYVALEACEGLLQDSVKLEPNDVRVTLDGSVVVAPSAERAEPDEAARSLVSVLSRLLVAAGPGVPPHLLQLVKQGGAEPGDLRRLHDAIEASLIPLNRGASRRVLARLVRESDRPPPPEDEPIDAYRLDAELDELLRDPVSRSLEPEPPQARSRWSEPEEEPITTKLRVPPAIEPTLESAPEPEPAPAAVPESEPVTESEAEREPVTESGSVSAPEPAPVPVSAAVPEPVPVQASVPASVAAPEPVPASAIEPVTEPTPEPVTATIRVRPPQAGTGTVIGSGFVEAASATATATESATATASEPAAEPASASAPVSASVPPAEPGRLSVPEPVPTRGVPWGLWLLVAVAGVGAYLLTATGVFDQFVQPAAPVETVATTPGGTIQVTVSPPDAQIFVFVGRGPTVAQDMSVRGPHEFIVFGRGLKPSRAVVPEGATWTSTDHGPLYELAVQPQPAQTPSGSLDLGPAETERLPSSEIGERGNIRVITNPPGAKVYRFIGVGPSTQIDAASIHEGQEVLVYHPEHAARRAVIGPSDWQAGEGETDYVASLDVELPPLQASAIEEAR